MSSFWIYLVNLIVKRNSYIVTGLLSELTAKMVYYSSMIKLNLTCDWLCWMCSETLVWLSTALKWPPITVSLMKSDNVSHVKERQNSCSFTNFDDVEWAVVEVMKKHRTHLIALQLLQLHTHFNWSDTNRASESCLNLNCHHTAFTHPDLSK